MKVHTEEQVLSWLSKANGPIALDTETTGLDFWKDNVTLIVLSDVDSAIAFGPEFASTLNTIEQPLDLVNFGFDFRMLYKLGVDLRGKKFRDAQLLFHLLDENEFHGKGGRASLDYLVKLYFKDNYKEVFWSKYKDINAAPEQEVLDYAIKDGLYTRRVCDRIRLELALEEIPESLIEHVHRLGLALYSTELEGVCIDMPHILALGQELKPLLDKVWGEMQVLEPAAMYSVQLDRHAEQVRKLWSPRGKKWKTLPVEEFNWNSHAQVQALLYDKLGLPKQFNKDKKTREMRLTTDDDALAKIEHLHSLPRMLRDYSGFNKVFTAFIEGTLERTREGRVYPSFNVNGTVTGRISSSDPNLQQLPSSGEWARVRGIYVPDPDHVLLSCDYSQLEVVIAAHFSRDPNLLRVVLGGESKHDITATNLNIPRATAKTVNFAMQYGASFKKIQQIINCDEKKAKWAWAKYWETYAGEKEVINECGAKVDMGDPIVSPWGRRRRFPTQFAEPWMKGAAKRQAYSSLIQGTGADCANWASYQIAERLRDTGWGRLLWPVHDELLISVRRDVAGKAAELLKRIMIDAGKVINLSVPLSVECSEPLERWEK